MILVFCDKSKNIENSHANVSKDPESNPRTTIKSVTSDC